MGWFWVWYLLYPGHLEDISSAHSITLSIDVIVDSQCSNCTSWPLCATFLNKVDKALIL